MRKTTLQISTGALEHNARTLRAALPEKVRMMAVVKADAYGHGLAQAGRAFLQGGAWGLAVAIVDEAAALRREGMDCPVLILGGTDRDSLEEAVLADASPAVFSPGMLRDLQAAAVRLGRRARAHLKIDTGMSRIGVREEAGLEEMLDTWRACPMVEMEGIFTHFCVSETDEEFTNLQNRRFCQAVNRARQAGFAPIAHAAATGAFENSAYQHDLVRPGLAMYGLGTKTPGLKLAQRLTTRPVRLQKIQIGDTVSYGRTFRAERETTVMTVPIGYGDGYPRLFSNRACALVEGKRAPQIGRVCMDMTMFDVTGIPGVSMESEVTLMGRQGTDCLSPEELAGWAETIPYEIMLGFSARVHRQWRQDI